MRGEWHPDLVAARADYEEAKRTGRDVEKARLQIAVALDIHNRSLGPWRVIYEGSKSYMRPKLGRIPTAKTAVTLNFGVYGVNLLFGISHVALPFTVDGMPTTAELLLVFEWADEILKQNNYILL